MKNQLSLLFVASIVTTTSAAWAAPAVPDGETPTTVAARPAVQAPTGVADDPNIDRGFIQPTAMTQPAGSLTYNNYELLLHGLTYGITNHLQTSVTVLAPIVRDMPLVGVAAVKWQFLSTSRLQLALQGSTTFARAATGNIDPPVGTDTGTTSRNAYLVGGGAFASYCLREDCSSLASVNATYQLAFGGGSNEKAQAIVYGASIVHRVSPHVKLLGEITSIAATTVADSNFTNASGALVSYGIRLHTAKIASDIGFMKPVSTGDDSSFVLGLPFINVSYRW